MLDRLWGTLAQAKPRVSKSNVKRRPVRRSLQGFDAEILEGRQLLTASIGTLSDLTVPAQMGYQVPLDGSGSTGTSQSFTVTSSNPDIAASVAQGPFLSLGVTHAASSANDVSFSGTLVFQLFGDLTKNTVSQIEQFVADGYYVGKDFTRILGGFPGTSDYVAQAGAPNADGSGDSGQPGTPFANEPVQQLAFTGPGQLALANAGGTATNDTQFFVTTGSPAFLDYNYTIFGQMVSGQSILSAMTKVAVSTNPNSGEVSLPTSRVTITSASISTSNLNGVIHLDTTQAKPGETATITVTATDPADHSQVSQSFRVVVGSYNGPTSTPINFRPFANSTSAAVATGIPKSLSLAGSSGNPLSSSTESLSYTLVSQPEHGTISSFNSSTGAFFYTPDANYEGTDSFQYRVTSTNSAKGPVTTSNAGTFNLTVSPSSTTSIAESNRIPSTSEVPAVGLGRVDLVRNQRQQVSRIVVHFTGALNPTQAGLRNTYRLATAGRGGSFTARNAAAIKFGKPVYDASNNTVTITPNRPFGLKRPVQLLVRGNGPSGLQDSYGRYIDGANTGEAGSNGTAILS